MVEESITSLSNRKKGNGELLMKQESKSIQDQILKRFFAMLQTKEEFRKLPPTLVEEFKTMGDLGRNDLLNRLAGVSTEEPDEN